MKLGATGVLALAAVAGGVFLAWRATKAAGSLADKVSSVAAEVGQAINPLSDQNIAYRGATAATAAVTGDDRPLGVQMWEWFNPAAVQREREAINGGGWTPTVTTGDFARMDRALSASQDFTLTPTTSTISGNATWTL